MCGLCGLFEGEAHWTDGAGIGSVPRRQARQNRVALANRVLRHFRLQLADWQGTKYLLSTPTGTTLLIDNLSALWPSAEKLLGRPCDPLDAELLASLEHESGDGLN